MRPIAKISLNDSEVVVVINSNRCQLSTATADLLLHGTWTIRFLTEISARLNNKAHSNRKEYDIAENCSSIEVQEPYSTVTKGGTSNENEKRSTNASFITHSSNLYGNGGKWKKGHLEIPKALWLSLPLLCLKHLFLVRFFVLNFWVLSLRVIF